MSVPTISRTFNFIKITVPRYLTPAYSGTQYLYVDSVYAPSHGGVRLEQSRTLLLDWNGSNWSNFSKSMYIREEYSTGSYTTLDGATYTGEHCPLTLTVKENGRTVFFGTFGIPVGKLNSPPTTPSTINLPSTIKGGASCRISWPASSDADGNLEGYIVERSYNGGSGWSQIYQGSSTSTSTTIPHGTSAVMFRVCAYDTEGARSGWFASQNKIVLNNRAPNAPSAINVPTKPQGGASISVTWSAASDPDGNLEGYRLERQWDGKGSWSQIYQGSNLSYSDTIPKGEHTSVAYRVRAYDAFGDTSDYTTSPTRAISNNAAPVIQCDLSGDLGDKPEGFTIPYTVTDPENQTVTVTEKVGGMVKRTHQVTLGQSNSFQITGAFFQKILNGKQTAEIVATDAEGASSTLALTFTKKVHKAVIMLSQPLAVDKQISVCIIKVLGQIPEDATFKVEVANNAGDDAPAWEDATDAAKRGVNYVFKNKTQAKGWKFGFRVAAERGKSEKSGFITTIQGGFQ